MKYIDCHTHLQTKSLINEYFENNHDCAVISIKALDSLIGNGDEFYEATKNYDNVFIIECVDTLKNIDRQLVKIKNNLCKYKTVGIKIYLGYQPTFADDQKLYKVYEFAKNNNLSVVFHCGVGAENLKSEDKTLNYASCLRINKIAKDFPSVNFIASHFDYPNFEDCANLVTNNLNVFTDISGIYENFDQNLNMVEKFISDIQPIMKKFPNIYKKVMFGTDYFGKGSGFSEINEYINTLKILFSENQLTDCLVNNCLKAYPKILTFMKSQDTLKQIEPILNT